jgi:methionine biosynthesis protein MetW
VDFASFYDAYWQGQGDTFDKRRQELLVRHVRPGDSVLHVDCGPGVLAARLSALGASVVGTDLSGEALRRARARGVAVQQVDLDREPLPFAAASFSVVLSDSQLEHRVDYDHYLDECVRVLRPGGRLVLCVPNTAHWRVRWWLLCGRFPYLADTPTDWLHLRFFTLVELKRLLAQRGLTLAHVAGYPSLWVKALYPAWLGQGRPARAYELLTALRPTLFARDLILVAVKPGDGGPFAVRQSPSPGGET